MSSPQTFARTVMNNMKGTGGELAGAKIRLFKAPVLAGPRTEVSDFPACDFVGYADSDAVVWGSVMHTGPDAVQCNGDVKEFIAEDGTTPNSIYGWVLLNAAGDDWIRMESFPEPVQVVEEGQGLALLPVLILPSDVFV